MFFVKGILRKDRVSEWEDDKGNKRKSRYLLIANNEGDFPVSVGVPLDMAVAPIGNEVFIKVEIYPFTKENGERKVAKKNVYVDGDKDYPKKEETDEKTNKEASKEADKENNNKDEN